jgi:hypothetical protein
MSCFAIKTAKDEDDEKNILILGPDFPYETSESHLLHWQAATVVSFGKHYSLVLPTTPSLWHTKIDQRKPVCLAVSHTEVYVCANGGPSPQHYLPCLLEFKTGKILANRTLPIAAYTADWEIVVPGPGVQPRSILKYATVGHVNA